MKQTCSLCGNEFDAREAQCPRCGHPVEQPAVPEPPAAAPAAPATPEPPQAPQPDSGPDVPPPPPPADGAGLPPAGAPTTPPPPRRRNPWPWIALGVLALLVVGAAVWYARISSPHPYEYDDTMPADTMPLAEPRPEAEEPGVTVEDYAEAVDSILPEEPADTVVPAAAPHNLVLSGTLVLESNPSTTCDVLIHANIEADGDVTGTASWSNTGSEITGLYNPSTNRLVLYEETGNRYEGYLASGSSYNGTYHDNNGTWRFTLNAN